jgi:ABC-type nitrate/sulfonate/bicarbonate transport system ATPase subunit
MEVNYKIRVNDLEKSYSRNSGTMEILKNISFDVFEDEFLVILGPGGCGKTTLLKIIAGQEDRGRSEVIYGDNYRIGFVFQNFSIFNWMTVQDNVEFGLKMEGVSEEKRREISKKYIDLVGLTGFEDYYPKQISGGMKQRVGVARMLAISPDIMLMDNPLGHLDAQTRFQLQDELLRIWDVENKTIVFVTNDVEEAIYLADRIILLSDLPAEVKQIWGVRFGRGRDDGILQRRNRTGEEFLALRNEISEVF